jgi:hypothetical protein
MDVADRRPVRLVSGSAAHVGPDLVGIEVDGEHGHG